MINSKEKKLARQAILLSIEEIKRQIVDCYQSDNSGYIELATAIKILAEAMEKLR